LSDWVRGLCDQLAENGVIAIAPTCSAVKPFLIPMRAESDLGVTGTANQGRPRRYIRLRTENPAGNGTLRYADFVGAAVGSSNTQI